MSEQLAFTFEPAEQTRLSRQRAEILARLKEGPATNVELGAIAQRFGGRIFDLRHKDGIPIGREQIGRGLFRYWLL
jgi:hypothetical protein